MHSRFKSAWSQLPEKLQTALKPIIDTPDFQGMLSAEQVNQLKADCGYSDSELAFLLLPFAAAYAVTPISHFNVGAIAQGISGNLYFGANMEFSHVAIAQTIHAEQCAVTHAWMKGEKQLTSITVNHTPCGHCRQFMNELRGGGKIAIRLPERQPATLHDYLPDSFGPADLAITTLLMDSVDHGYSTPSRNRLLCAAIEAANQSHAPYSQSHSGIALQLKDGSLFTGRYAENAAFNPSLPPLQAALIMVNMAGKDLHVIEQAVLVEKQDAIVKQWCITENTLQALGCQQKELIYLN
ncbi:TPA: cytidine deaminase [Providencia stuartii]|uniref:Cytidine deaminase n=1 Tax=Providencia stuartii TaxID=588 RepID=A0AAJ1JHR2_PROST|nr:MULTISPECIES: cytidine deaminase [Providencia]APG52902.1 cytidine deaminase [Providencia stuartii]AVL40927.1 cytidine deaminase [Providencia stuartii]EMA3640273.1 cytidine deaminase [Providencia stuartii]KNZ85652.1 cytidine deaminase [Providencia stuartii]MBG5903569.1 cytidine deaminase [Providencia stuartii]